ncbi:MAG: nucleotidyltransferase family protein [Acidobacteriota bacterium]|nr:nucleotidyltransferase family protein [Acidobacteriota bacterium]
MDSWNTAVYDRWLRAGLPRSKAAVLSALQLRTPELTPALALNEPEWDDALDFADRSGLTLFLPTEAMPDAARSRIARSAERNRQRLHRLEQLYLEVSRQLQEADIPFAFLKGLAQCGLSGHAPEHRVQYDIDLLTLPDRASDACMALGSLGFVQFHRADGFAPDHLPPMIRRTGWQFRGDYFDCEIPTAVEVHFRLWAESTLRLRAPGVEQFWVRRHSIRHTLAPPDALGHSALHVLKHLLLGAMRPFHVYELACMLERNHEDGALWREWRADHDPQLRRLETIAFGLAREWFGCRFPREAEEDWDALPLRARTWFDEFAAGPLQPSNKNELWLHCTLLATVRDRASVIRLRLLPVRLPAPVDGVYLTDQQLSWRRRLLSSLRQARFVAGRIGHHARAMLRLAGSGARWWWKLRMLSE